MMTAESSGATADIFRAALAAVDPYESVKSHVGLIESIYHANKCRQLLLLSFGKAAYLMAKALTDHTDVRIASGIVITKYGHAGASVPAEAVRVREAGHPIPDDKGYRATREAIETVRGADEKTLVTCLISGGGSSLFVAPYDGIALQDKQVATDLLLRGGATISEINTVRKHLSSVKGGRLAGLIYPGRTVSLILSDVIGDRLDVIASGPTAPDNTTYGDAYDVIREYDILERLPLPVHRLIEEGMEGRAPETPKAGDPLFRMVENIVVANNKRATEAAREKAEELGFAATILSSEIEGEARNVAGLLAGRAKVIRESMGQLERKGVCLISGGEPTVTVRGRGIGGRNTELALAYAIEIAGVEGITFLSAGTDGTDGPTDAAGAMADWNTVQRARDRGLKPESYLENNDSYSFFKEVGGLFVTGPTGTNAMDLQIAVIEAEASRCK